MNCGAERINDVRRFWEGVPVCIECFSTATAVSTRMQRQMEHLVRVQRDKIRQCLVEGKLVLNVLREDAKLVAEGVYPSLHGPNVQEGSNPGGGA